MTTTTRLSLTKPAGSDLVDISVLNANSDKIDAAIGAKVVTSGTRPSTPFDGQIIYETDTGRTYIYQTSTTSWKSVDKPATIVTSSTRPTVTYPGQIIYETDTTLTYVRSGSDWKLIGGVQGVSAFTRPSTDGQLIVDGSSAVYYFNGAQGIYLPVAQVPTFPTRSDRNTAIAAPLQGTETFITEAGYVERYYSAYDASTNPGGAATAGWYPAYAGALSGSLVRNSTAVSVATGTNVNLTTAFDTGHNVGMTIASGVITVPTTGLYRVTANVFWSAGAGSTYRYMFVTRNLSGTTSPTAAQSLGATVISPAGSSVIAHTQINQVVKLTAGDALRVMVNQGSGASISISDNTSPYTINNGLVVEWVGVSH